MRRCGEARGSGTFKYSGLRPARWPWPVSETNGGLVEMTSDRNTQFARWDDVVSTFRRHVKHYATHGGGENALVGLRAEGAVTLQYAGRVVYELFQNALDKAKTRVEVRFTDGVLLVGNDGDGVRVDPEYDYANPIEGEGRSDFHALCALHTSNKSADREFGNKGIGFRSVFGVADRVKLWSRCDSDGWWGMELRQRLVPTEWVGSADSVLDDLILGAGKHPRPSFHFPCLLRSDDDPVPDCGGISTFVLLEVVDEQHQLQIAQEVELLRKTRFQFVGQRRPGLDLHLDGVSSSSDAGWRLVSGARYHAGFTELAELANRAEHPVRAPRVAVAWSREHAVDGEECNGLFYNHLPTRMSTGLPIDVHADFQVKADREGMALDAGNAVGAYNLALLQRAAEAVAEALAIESRQASPRPDFWRLAGRPQDAPCAWTEALRAVLFPSGSFDLWVELASNYFRENTGEAACRDFWNESRRWLETIAGCGHWTKTWAGLASKLCDALSAGAVPAIPVVADEGHRSVALPSRQGQGARAERRVFYWSPRGEASIPPVPRVLLRTGRVVTSFALDAFEGPAGVQPFAEAQLLPELRQMPNDPAALDVADGLSSADQASLILFAYRLTTMRRRSTPHFAWRAFADSQDGEQVGRALATIFLPTVDGGWEPSRQLSKDRVEVVRLGNMLNQPDDLDAFLAVLGVAPEGGVPLVEGGDGAVVEPLELPPRPQEAGRGRPIAPLEPILEKGAAPASVLASLEGLPPDSPRSRVHELVRATPWLERDRFRAFDGVPPLPEFVAPCAYFARS